MSAIIDRIFSHAGFDRLDKDALVSKHDVSSAISEIKSPLRSQTGQSPQTGGVISAIPPEGIVIATPGTYSFAGDLPWHPESTACSAITITASGVVLDLAGFNLTATVQDNSQLIVGIMVQGDVSNVTIRNGTLANLCFYGICADTVKGLTTENI